MQGRNCYSITVMFVGYFLHNQFCEKIYNDTANIVYFLLSMPKYIKINYGTHL